MINFDDYTNKNRTEHNKIWSHTLDKPYRILIIGSSESGKTNVLLNLIENETNCMLKIRMKQNINIYLIKEKVQA